MKQTQTKTARRTAARGEKNPPNKLERTFYAALNEDNRGPYLVTLSDPEASRLAGEFAREFEHAPEDVIAGIILLHLPQALDEWKTAKRDLARGKSPPVGDYWAGFVKAAEYAKRRRLRARRRPPAK